jgi:hypothetical protein
MVGDQFCLWLNDAAGANPTQALNLPRLNNVIGVVRSAYEDLISIRDRLFPLMPVFIHGYDFAIPTGIGACGFGPWLKPSLEYRHWTNQTINIQIVHTCLLQFDALMQQIEKAHKNVIYVRTQGTLAAADWSNELQSEPRRIRGACQEIFGGTASQIRSSLSLRLRSREPAKRRDARPAVTAADILLPHGDQEAVIEATSARPA